jgi:hypothetical protein
MGCRESNRLLIPRQQIGSTICRRIILSGAFHSARPTPALKALSGTPPAEICLVVSPRRRAQEIGGPGLKVRRSTRLLGFCRTEGIRLLCESRGGREQIAEFERLIASTCRAAYSVSTGPSKNHKTAIDADETRLLQIDRRLAKRISALGIAGRSGSRAGSAKVPGGYGLLMDSYWIALRSLSFYSTVSAFMLAWRSGVVEIHLRLTERARLKNWHPYAEFIWAQV